MKVPASSLQVGNVLACFGDRVTAVTYCRTNFRKVCVTRVYPSGRVKTGEWFKSTLIEILG